eukprot:Awhi_evm1s2549
MEDVGYVFMVDDDDQGKLEIPGVELEINTEEGKISRRSQFRLSYAQTEGLKENIKQMFKNGFLQESNSDWQSPVMVVKKSDNTWRFVIDLRGVNSLLTEVSAYPLPRIDDLLSKIKGDKWFAKIDLSKAFWQIPLSPKDTHKTALAVDGVLYEYTVVPMGLTHSPGMMSRVMNMILKDVPKCAPYMDDVLVLGSTFEELMKAEQVVENSSEGQNSGPQREENSETAAKINSAARQQLDDYRLSGGSSEGMLGRHK